MYIFTCIVDFSNEIPSLLAKLESYENAPIGTLELAKYFVASVLPNVHTM